MGTARQTSVYEWLISLDRASQKVVLSDRVREVTMGIHKPSAQLAPAGMQSSRTSASRIGRCRPLVSDNPGRSLLVEFASVQSELDIHKRCAWPAVSFGYLAGFLVEWN